MTSKAKVKIKIKINLKFMNLMIMKNLRVRGLISNLRALMMKAMLVILRLKLKWVPSVWDMIEMMMMI